MQPEPRCSHCGQVIPWGQVECPLCSPHAGPLWSLSRETFLAVTLLSLTVMFIVTGVAAKFYHAKERGLGEEWYSRGETELQAGRAPAALEDFRTALAYSQDNVRYQLRLAQALMAAGQLSEARNYLLSVWEREPGNGTVNLELAHLAVRQRSQSEALRFFHGAIYGAWEEDTLTRRRAVRLELVQFLLDSGDNARAQSELIALAAGLPRDPQLEAQAGTLMLQAGGYDQALKLFRQALEESPRMEAALLGAGEASFDLYDFAGALHYLARAVTEAPQLPRAASLLETTRSVLSVDPLLRGLSSSERARRTRRAYDQALQRLQDCAARRGVDLKAKGGGADLQELYAAGKSLEPHLRESELRRDSDLVSTTIDWVFQIELTTERECGPPQGLDQALLLLARAQGGGRS
jgi:tetratricopeptide (TPR) repeat protein